MLRILEWVAISFSSAWRWKVKVKSCSRVQLFATPWTAAYQAPLSMGYSRHEYWSRLLFPSPGASRPRDWTWVSRIVGGRFTVWATREVLTVPKSSMSSSSVKIMEATCFRECREKVEEVRLTCVRWWFKWECLFTASSHWPSRAYPLLQQSLSYPD